VQAQLQPPQSTQQQILQVQPPQDTQQVQLQQNKQQLRLLLLSCCMSQ
jgi:hypothetical protein